MNTGKDNKNNVYVAVIDDNPKLRDMSVKQLENSGYTVLFQSGYGQDALQKIKEGGKLPDVCLIEEDFATAKLLLEKYPDLKVLISSTDDNEERSEEHTSELQSRENLVCRLLLEKKKT